MLKYWYILKSKISDILFSVFEIKWTPEFPQKPSLILNLAIWCLGKKDNIEINMWQWATERNGKIRCCIGGLFAYYLSKHEFKNMLHFASIEVDKGSPFKNKKVYSFLDGIGHNDPNYALNFLDADVYIKKELSFNLLKMSNRKDYIDQLIYYKNTFKRLRL